MRIQKVMTYLDDNNMPYIVKETTKYTIDGRTKHSNPQMIYDLAKGMRITERSTEMVMLFIFDTANHLLAVNEVSTGTVSSSSLSPREIAQTMLLVGGVNCVVIHNHPSGDATPSDTDIKITNTLKSALNILGLYLLDHLIVARNEYTSMSEYGII